MNVSEAFKSRSMKSMLGDHVLRNGLSRLTYDQNTNCNMKFLKGDSGNADKSLSLRHTKKESIFSTMNKIVKGKLRSGADKVFRGIFSVREGEQLLKVSRCCLSTTAGPIAGRLFISTDKVAFCSDRPIAKVSTQTGVSLRFHYKVVIPRVRGKLRSGADKVFREIFSVREGEQLLKASRCCLSTTAGPIAGRLFISTDKVAFCSNRPIAKVSTPTGDSVRFHYKVVIPLGKIQRFNQSENRKKPSQKYLQVVTKDAFEFWFMGFLNYRKMFNCLQQVVSEPYLSHIE